MKIEAGTILAIELGAFFLFFLLLPLATVLSRFPAIWRADRGTGVVIGGVVLLTGAFFALFIVGLLVLLFGHTNS